MADEEKHPGHDPEVHDSPSEEDSPIEQLKPRELPLDLPRSLDDRRNYPSYNQETEYYDAWQGVLKLHENMLTDYLPAS